jgi:cytochrome c553
MWRTDARLLTLIALAAIVPVDRPLLAQTAATPSGEAVYQRRCAACHDQVSDRIPAKASLNQMPSARILRALDFGAMMTVAYPMSRAERQAVAS